MSAAAAGIAAAGAYFPAGRLPRSVMASAWEMPAARGERSVAGADEDAITMAVAAGRRAIEASGIAPAQIGTLLLATTTSPYRDKLGAAIAAAALGLADEARTIDVGGSLRAGLSALRAGADAVLAGDAEASLVLAADCRVMPAGSPAEQTAGDGAAAMLLTEDGAAASLDAWSAVHSDLTARWHAAGDQVMRDFEPRLETGPGYAGALASACSSVLGTAGIEGGEIAQAAVAGPDARSPGAALRRAGVDAGAVVPSLIDVVGDTGTAAPLLALARALQRAGEGERMLVAAYGDGAEAAVLTRGPGAVGELVDAALRPRTELHSYEQYAAARDLMSAGPVDDLQVSPVAYWRRRRAILGRFGGRCASCATVQFPSSATCVECGARRTQEAFQLSDRGTVFTFTNDHLVAGRYVERAVPRCVVEVDGGGRFYTSMTDCEPDDVRIGMPVELTFRNRGSGGGFHNYGWKCRPAEASA